MALYYFICRFAFMLRLSTAVHIVQECPLCSPIDNMSQIYSEGHEWTFAVKCSNRPIYDTIKLRTTDLPWDYGSKKIIWYSVFRDTISLKIIKSVVEENGIDNTNNEVYLHPPHSGYWNYTELLPVPYIKFPITKDSNNINWKFPPRNNWKDLINKKVKGESRFMGKVYCDTPALADSCWEIDATSTCVLGSFNAKYYFHERYGFVYFFYDFGKYTVEMKLTDYQQISPKESWPQNLENKTNKGQ